MGKGENGAWCCFKEDNTVPPNGKRYYKLVQGFPKEERFALSNQLTRAAVSISSNIEGSSRTSEKDCNRFLEVSSGSSCEWETQPLTANAAGFGDAILCGKLLADVEQEQKR